MKKKIIIAVCVLIVASLGIYMVVPKQALPTPPTASALLQKNTLRSTVSTTGSIQSTSTINVYAEVTYPVQKVNVEIGDRVNVGDVLCLLKTEELEKAIQKEELDLKNNIASTQQQVKTAKKKYSDEKALLDKGLNNQINSAKDALTVSQSNLDAAQRTLENAVVQQSDQKKRLEDNLNDSMISAKAEVESARINYERTTKEFSERNKEERNTYKDLLSKKDDLTKSQRSWQKTVDDLKKQAIENPLNQEIQTNLSKANLELTKVTEELEQVRIEIRSYEADDDYIDPDDPTRRSLKTLRQAVEDAERAYATARQRLNSLTASVSDKMLEYDNAVTEAQASYNSAKKSFDSATISLQSAQTAVGQNLSDALQSIETNKLAANQEAERLVLEQKKEDLAKGIMRAPVSGTITAVFTSEGATSSGMMFMIENTDSLEVVVRIKEYDVNTVKPGMKAVIKADAIDGQEFEGTLKYIAPTAIKENPNLDNQNATGKTGNIEFEAKVLVNTSNTPLKIGMNGRADIIIQEQKDVFSIPFEALSADAEGKDIVYTAKKQADGTYLPEAIHVTLGIETDYEVEIFGEGLTEGMQILSDGKSVVPDMPIKLADTESAPMIDGVGSVVKS